MKTTNSTTKQNKLAIIFRFFSYILPIVLFFSYQPLIHFGSSESMNFEISLPIIWLVLFDVLAIILMWQQKLLFKSWHKKWIWLLLPIFLSISLLWSLNPLRGLLTVGIIWLIYLAIDGFWSLKSLLSETKFKETFWKIFFGSTIIICIWCWFQCILDLSGVPREASLMCEGCTYFMFGFPHPDGFAIEPQFMGNLLLAPTIILGWLMLRSRSRPAGPFAFGNSRPKGRAPRAAGANSRAVTLRNAARLKHYAIQILLFLILVATLFLTFSRGAIYAFIISMIVMTIWGIIISKNAKQIIKRTLSIWALIIVSFLFTLNAQGIMAAASPTNDTYVTGVTKVLNHLSLGVIDVRNPETPVENTVENSEENSVENSSLETTKTAVFNGYVAESTDTRLRLSDAAFKIWHQDFTTVMLGVGLGGAGQALYINNLSPAPKEIVQNQYASLLLETGLIGIALFILSLALVIRTFFKSPLKLALICLLVAYGISLCFFSGLPNALHIYLLPAIIYSIGFRKKLVS